MKFILATLLLSLTLQTFAKDERTYLGTDNKGNDCTLTIVQKFAPHFDEYVKMEKIKGAVVTNYSKSIIKVSQTVSIDEYTDRLSLTPNLNGSRGDEYQNEQISIKIDGNLRPVSFDYFNNTGLRVMKPLNTRCTLH